MLEKTLIAYGGICQGHMHMSSESWPSPWAPTTALNTREIMIEIDVGRGLRGSQPSISATGGPHLAGPTAGTERVIPSCPVGGPN